MAGQIEDKLAIQELCFRYSRAVDRLDRELLESTYWPDGSDDHGAFAGSAPDFIDWCLAFVERWTSTHHSNTNFLIEIDGDTATGECHWTGYYRYDVDGQPHDHLAAGRYLDRYERRNGEWRILHRHCIGEWSRIEPCLAPPRPGESPSRRDRNDPVYALRPSKETG